jgi:20S proteasome subunit beta 7
MIGTCYEEDYIATGFGGYLALPIIRDRWKADMNENEAKLLLEDCLKVLFYRDCRASSRVLIAKATEMGTEIMDPVELATNWNVANFDKTHNVPAGMDGSSW